VTHDLIVLISGHESSDIDKYIFREPIAFVASGGHNDAMTYQELIAYFGTCAKAARALGVDRRVVHRWKRAGIPLARMYQIQVITEGVLLVAPPVES
jgi:hypothetical protein